MTPRQRVLAALNHEEPDRVPIDCGAMRSSGIQAIAYHRLMSHLGITADPPRVYDMVQQLAEPDPSYLERFDVDALNAGYQFDPKNWKPWTLPDGTPCRIPAYLDVRPQDGDWLVHDGAGRVVARMAAGTTYFSQTTWPMSDDNWYDQLPALPEKMPLVIWAALPEPMYADGLTEANVQRIAAHVRRLRETHEQAIVLAVGANLFEWGTFLRRMDNFLMDLASDRIRAEALLDKLVECHLASFDRLLPSVGDLVDVIHLGDDLGMESGPFFAPRMYREIFKPRHRILLERIKKAHPHAKTFLHSCGSISSLLEDLIEAGFDIINPVQISARDMAPADLKRRFGRHVVFWGGGCDTQKILPRATPQQVKDHVRRNVDILAPGGGFVFCPVHNILSEVPPENVVAMYEAVHP